LKDKHVLITGHTGFKGSWLTAMLHVQGAKVSGIALEPQAEGLFQLARLHDFLENDIRQDIRDGEALTRLIDKISPDVVIHLAAQPLVLASYQNPVETYETNVMGTLNVLQAIEATRSVQATLVITTDKVYRQDSGANKAFVETDPLGAADPYSTSKAMADLLTQSWVASHPDSRIAIARAGNVIGGGDVAENRLLPDLVKQFGLGEVATIRNPNSIRPWQHVLDCLNGYLLLTEKLIGGNLEPKSFNFGPDSGSPLAVMDVANIAIAAWGDDARVKLLHQDQPHESSCLVLDSGQAKAVLGWREKLNPNEAVEWTLGWHKRLLNGASPRELLMGQISAFGKI
jgi:CDP-glucose 4,6-dehydratase